MAEPTLKELLEDLANGTAEDRRFAAEDLGDLGDPVAVDALVAALEDEDVAVREAVGDALVSIGGPTVCKAVVPLLDHDEAPVRNLALEVFERLRADAIDACIELYSSSSHDLRKIAVDTLGKIEETRESDGFATLVAALDDDHVNVSAAACEALGRLGGAGAVNALAEHVGRHPWMDSTIFLSLARIGSQEARDALDSFQEEGLAPEARHVLRAAREMV